MSRSEFVCKSTTTSKLGTHRIRLAQSRVCRSVPQPLDSRLVNGCKVGVQGFCNGEVHLAWCRGGVRGRGWGLTARYWGPRELSPARLPHMEAALSCCICC